MMNSPWTWDTSACALSDKTNSNTTTSSELCDESRKWFQTPGEPVCPVVSIRSRRRVYSSSCFFFLLVCGVCFFGNASILCGTVDFLLVSLFTCDFIHFFCGCCLFYFSYYIYSRRRNGAVVSSVYMVLFFSMYMYVCFSGNLFWSKNALIVTRIV